MPAPTGDVLAAFVVTHLYSHFLDDECRMRLLTFFFYWDFF